MYSDLSDPELVYAVRLVERLVEDRDCSNVMYLRVMEEVSDRVGIEVPAAAGPSMFTLTFDRGGMTVCRSDYDNVLYSVR